MKIAELTKKDIFYWFEKICGIPHGSGNTEKISDFCAQFAESRNLKYYRDKLGNVVIYKNASSDRQNELPVIIQGHLDMVCDKTAECPKNMETEGIDLIIDGDYITAEGTTLGADDGIALAYILALLDSDDISHPPIEVLLTVDEETGMYGANGLDYSVLSGRRLINIDSEEEGILTVSCAGGARALCEISVFFESENEGKDHIKINISGLLGGHSGIEIDKNRKNAIHILGRLLYNISDKITIGICALNGGSKMNIIPNSAEAVISCNKYDTEKISAIIADFAEKVKNDYHGAEPNISVTAEKVSGNFVSTDKSSTEKIIFALMQAPDGIIAMSPEISGMVQSSLNMGIAELDKDSLKLSYLTRSNDKFGNNIITEKLRSFYGYIGGKVTIDSEYPAWEYREDSPLRDAMCSAFVKLYKREPMIQGIHAGLECGIFSAKIPDADMVSFGPDIENAHTPNERLNISSAERTYDYLIEILKNI